MKIQFRTWISNCIYIKLWRIITHIAEITFPYPNLKYPMLVKGAIGLTYMQTYIGYLCLWTV